VTLSYFWRLLCLSSAVFFLANLAAGAAAALTAPLLIRLSGRLAPARAARLLLAFRLAPPVVASTLVLALCIPSYVWLEPRGSVERVSAACLFIAALGLTTLIAAAARASHAVATSNRVLRRRPPSLALAGILRPRLIVSPAVRQLLTPDQLEAALAHERAHWDSRDNLKRLLLLLAPGILPFCSGFTALERAWHCFTEWAADDCAAAGSPARSLSLAAALVQVARLQAHAPATPLVTSLLGEAQDLSARIGRLLHPARVSEGRPSHPAISIALACAFLAIVLQPSTLAAAHSILERLID
jgi:Zn-dependent protease with chaperone function